MFDEKFDEIAGAIADGILETIDMHVQNEKKLYRVQVGAYVVRDYANRLLNKLQNEGFPAYLVYENGMYKVQVGTYEDIDNAVKMERRLRGEGYNTFITSR